MIASLLVVSDDVSQNSTKSSSTLVRNSIYADHHLSSKTSLPTVPEYVEDTSHRDTKYRTVSTEPQREDMREDIPMEEFTIHGDETDVIAT
jgi:hypothetical protein